MSQVYAQYAFPEGEVDRVNAEEVTFILGLLRDALRTEGVPEDADIWLLFAEDEVFKGKHLLRMTWRPEGNG